MYSLPEPSLSIHQSPVVLPALISFLSQETLMTHLAFCKWIPHPGTISTLSSGLSNLASTCALTRCSMDHTISFQHLQDMLSQTLCSGLRPNSLREPRLYTHPSLRNAAFCCEGENYFRIWSNLCLGLKKQVEKALEKDIQHQPLLAIHTHVNPYAHKYVHTYTF